MLNTREYAKTVFNSLNDTQLIDFLKLFADENILARVESDMIAKGVERKRYRDFSEILREIEEDEDE